MLGQPVAYDKLPYLYTDQYDVGMEFSGWIGPDGYDRLVTRDDVAGQAFHAFGWPTTDWSQGCRSTCGTTASHPSRS
jgi:hypothetical protein